MFISRRRRLLKSEKKWFKPLRVFLIAFILFFLTSFFVFKVYPYQMVKITYGLGFSDGQYDYVLDEVLPGVSSKEMHWETFVNDILYSITSVDSRNPTFIVANELNLAWAKSAAVGFFFPAPIEEEGGEEDFYLPGQEKELEEWFKVHDNDFPPIQLNGEPMILIYNTHNAESYKPSDGSSRLEGKNGGVVSISKKLAYCLESKYSIKTIQSDVIHDYPDWTKSYLNSMKTATQLLKEYQSVQVVLDIHRDAGLEKRSDTTVKIGNKTYAKIMIVIGTEHPQWQKNLVFAEKIAAKANEKYPGLIKTIRLHKERRYNQHLHPQALLLEFGSDLNTREDAENSAELFSEVLANVLKNQ